jgi:hypothetical protein
MAAGPGLLGTMGLAAGRLLIGRRFCGAIAEMQRAQWLAPDELLARQRARLATLLEHAAREVPFYRELYRARGLAPGALATPDDLARLPVMDKTAFRARPLEDFLAASVGPHRRLPYNTSGSTGEPFSFILDRQALPLVFASHLFYDSWYGLEPFDRCVRVMAPPAADAALVESAPLLFRARQRLNGACSGSTRGSRSGASRCSTWTRRAWRGSSARWSASGRRTCSATRRRWRCSLRRCCAAVSCCRGR